MSETKISACILTFNNERTIEQCLRSVRWADEIIVLDHYSTDGTEEICRRHTDRFFQKEWTSYRDEYNHVTDFASNQWVLCLDSDEELSEELAAEVKSELSTNTGQWAGYLFPRMTFYLGRWIKHGEWFPDYVLRVYDKTRGAWAGRDLHPRPVLDGPVKKLTGLCLHHNYRSISEQIQTIDRYSETAAEVLHGEGKRGSLVKLLLHPPLRFFRDYVLKRGFADGLPGFIIAFSTMYYVFIKYAKLWELEKGLKEE